ncbi:MAG TPA: RES family NAD+ phosphorylase [Rhodanobacteraceae bacterium]|nr:RES family NAD+ phosphorylase [Rhodanobacteraceae bacterium]
MTRERCIEAARRISARPWRVVEAQNRVSTMRLVDTLEEQSALEDLLEASKPPVPPEASRLHWLLATPFRYPAPPPKGSRFRAIGDAGVWYGAAAVTTALAEVGYWRLRFLADSPQTPDLPPVAHTAFRAAIGGPAIVLYEPPFERQHKRWQDRNDYTHTQSLAWEARAAGVAIIRYHSVRDPQHRACDALLTPEGFRKTGPLEQHTWLLKVTRTNVLAEATLSGERIAFDPAALGMPSRPEASS